MKFRTLEDLLWHTDEYVTVRVYEVVPCEDGYNDFEFVTEIGRNSYDDIVKLKDAYLHDFTIKSSWVNAYIIKA